MKRLLWITFLMLVTISCQTKSVPKTDSELIEGNWALAVFKNDPTTTGTLALKADKTFSGSMSSEKLKKTSLISGHFALSRKKVESKDVLFVDFVIETMEGKPANSGMGMHLFYDPEHNLLRDLLMLAYARPEELEQARASLNSSPPSK